MIIPKLISCKNGPFFERVFKFRNCFKKEIFYNYFSNGTVSGCRLLPRVNQVTLLQTQRTSDGRMAAQRKGSWKDCSALLFFDRRLLSLSLSSLFLEQHFPRRFSLVVFVLRYTDVYSLTSSVFPTSVFDAHSILWTETASRSLYSPCIRRHDMQN